MKKLLFTLSMLLILPTAMQAQDTFALEQYFSTILQGKEPSQAPSGRIKRAKVEEYKDVVWQAWCRANRTLREETLPPIRPLTSQASGRKSGHFLPEQDLG